MYELRLAFRATRTTPIVSTVAVISLALGIGANTAIFSLVSSVMLRALPVPASERLAILTSGPVASRPWSYAIWEELRQRSQLFDGAIAWTMVRFNLAQSGEVQLAEGLLANGDYFNVLGVQPLLGRTFTVSDDLRGGGSDGAVAVISYAFWQRHYGGASEAIGARLTVEGVPFTVVGVTPPEFFGTEVGRWFDIAVPIARPPRSARCSRRFVTRRCRRERMPSSARRLFRRHSRSHRRQTASPAYEGSTRAHC
jgi:hypothetical protein